MKQYKNAYGETITVVSETTYETPIKGFSTFGEDNIEVIGEQVVELEDGRVLEQYLYNIVGYIAQNGQPFVSLKANIII